jgi:hypothetical protein
VSEARPRGIVLRFMASLDHDEIQVACSLCCRNSNAHPGATASAAAIPQSTDQAIVLRQATEHVFGQFSSVDPSGCVRTELSVYAANLVDQQPPGAPDKRSLLPFIHILQYDDCTSTLLQNADGFQELDQNALKVSDSPTPARLIASLTLLDPARGSFDVNVDLTWSVADRPSPIRDTIRFELAPGLQRHRPCEQRVPLCHCLRDCV